MYELKYNNITIKKENLVFCGYDTWDRATWKYNNIYLKDVSLTGSKNNMPNVLYDTADGEFDGEPNNPYKIILI